MTYATVLTALADPTRRAVFERLSRGAMAAGKLAEGLPVSRPAVSQHLRVLKAARLVRETRAGARRLYHIDPRGVGALRGWLDQFWDETLEAFRRHAECEARNR